MLHAAPRSGGVVKSERPLWVISERRVTFAQCPLYPHLLSFGCPLSAMCGRLRVGKENLHVAALVGAAMCSAFECGSHDRWP